MKQRNPLIVLLLGMFTGGIYPWYWAVKTKGEMNKLGEEIPTAWIWLIPFVGAIWWLWKYSEGVEHVTNEKLSGVLSFILLFLLGTIGQAIVQDTFNKITPIVATPESVQTQPLSDQPVVEQPMAFTPFAPAPEPVAMEPSQPVATPAEPPVNQPLVQ